MFVFKLSYKLLLPRLFYSTDSGEVVPIPLIHSNILEIQLTPTLTNLWSPTCFSPLVH